MTLIGDFAKAVTNKVTALISSHNSDGNAHKTLMDAKANDADLHTVAKSGKYTDLTDKPTIPSGSITTPSADTTSGSAGSSSSYSKADHSHPKSTLYAESSHTHDDRYYTESEIDTKLNAKAGTSTATQSANGLMSSTDKTKLDGIDTGANKTTVDSSLSTTSTNPVQNKVVNTALAGKASTSTATTSVAGLMSAADKTKLDGIATGANKTTIDSSLSSESTNPVQNKVINTALSGKAASDHNHSGTYNKATYSQTVASNATGAYEIGKITVDGSATTIYGKDTNTTYSAATTSANGLMSSTDKTKLDGIATGANKITVDSSLSTTSTNPVQNKVVNSALAGKAGTSAATQSAAGLMSAADKTKLDGIATGANATTYSNATQSADGLMSSSDKTKLDGIDTGANKITVDSSLSASSTNPVQNKIINTALGGKANNNHASTATTFGAASTTNYGHAKLSTATDSTSTSLAATPSAVKAAYDLASQKTITVEKLQTAESGYVATYVVKQNGTQVGSSINIPKDYLVKSAALKVVGASGAQTASQLGTGYSTGDKYIDFTINVKEGTADTDSHIYLNVKDLVDAYTAGTGLTLTSGNQFKHTNSVTAQSTTAFKKLSYDSEGHITGAANVEAADLPTHYHSQYLSSHQDISGKVNISDIVDNLTSTNTDKPLSAKQGKELKTLIDGKEDKSNKVTSWSTTTTDDHYPSEKLVKAGLDGKAASDHNHDGTYLKSYTPPTASTTQAGIIQIGTGALNAAAGNHTHSGYLTSVTSSDIVDGTIVNADISSSANIDQNKINGLTAALDAKLDDSNFYADNLRTSVSDRLLALDAGDGEVFWLHGKLRTNPTTGHLEYTHDSETYDELATLDDIPNIKTINGTSMVGTGDISLATNDHNHSGVYQPIGSYEVTTNKVTSSTGISSSSTDTQYPSAKATYDAIDNVLDNIILQLRS